MAKRSYIKKNLWWFAYKDHNDLVHIEGPFSSFIEAETCRKNLKKHTDLPAMKITGAFLSRTRDDAQRAAEGTPHLWPLIDY